MSVTSIVRRARPGSVAPDSSIRLAADEGEDKSEKTLTTALDTLGNYIPGDVMAIFIFITATLPAVGTLPAAFVGLYVGLAFCVFIVVTDYLLRRKKALATDLRASGWALFAGVTGFFAWAHGMPGSGLSTGEGAWGTQVWAVIAFVWSMVLVRLSAFFEPAAVTG